MNQIECWNNYAHVAGEASRILLMGIPGTGKTTTANKTGKGAGKIVYNITLHEDSSVSELLGSWMPKGGSFDWVDGTGIRAWKEGAMLVINEVDKASGSVMTALHAILDDPEIARLTLPTGETVAPKKGFQTIATMNGRIIDLPLALSDRFDIKLEITEPHPDALTKLPPLLAKMVQNAYRSEELNVTFREVASFAKLIEKGLDMNICAQLIFGKKSDDILAIMSMGVRSEELLEEDKKDSLVVLVKKEIPLP